MHGYFLRPGDASKGITFSVDRIHDGRSFSTRRTQAFQEGVPIFSMIASFQEEDPGIEHQAEMPAGLPAPEDLPDLEDHLAGLHPMSKRLFTDRPLDLRHIPSPIYLAVQGDHVPRQAVWMRTRRAIPDDPATHRAALAYLSDLTIQESILRAHGVAWATPGLKVASLDHAMWWHRPGRVDDWMLYVQESPSARGGRGLATGRIYSRDGMLVASVAQEIMVRVPMSAADGA
jgi:acyl-CoA thioesterase-2